MNRVKIYFGVCLTVCIMMSVVTAVPQSNSKPVIEYIQKIEESRTTINEKTLEKSLLDPIPNGILDLIRQLISLIIQFILKLIEIIRDLIGIVSLIEYLINLIMVLITAIFNLIEAILNLFTPKTQII
jgi:phage-related protein